jgi:hypothetical protein
LEIESVAQQLQSYAGAVALAVPALARVATRGTTLFGLPRGFVDEFAVRVFVEDANCWSRSLSTICATMIDLATLAKALPRVLRHGASALNVPGISVNPTPPARRRRRSAESR